MKRHHLLLLAATVCVALFTGCSSEAPQPVAKKEVKPPAPVGGQFAAFEMYKVARSWAPDAMVLHVENADIPEVKAEPGKFGAWKATFASPAGHSKRDYVYSVVESSVGVHKGVFPGSEGSYVASPATRIFAVNEVKIDTVAALEEAQKQKDIAAYAEKHPELPVQFVLDWSVQTVRPAWRVYWGATLSTSSASVFVDSGTGDFLKKLH
jgi:hypothetical protein